MITAARNKAPAGWILLPFLSVSAASALAAWLTGSVPLTAVVVLATSVPAALWAERWLSRVVEPISQIAAGDRYAALPERSGSGPMAEIAAAAERMRQC